jgi:hypothetical protein
VAEGLVKALASPEGVAGQVGEAAYLSRPDARSSAIELLRQRVERIEARAARARSRASETSDNRVADKFVRDAENDERELEVTLRELAQLELESDDGVDLQPVAALPDLLSALSAIGRATDTVDHEVAAAVTRIIPRFELHPGSSLTAVRWLATVLVPLKDGYVLELGPIWGEAPVRSLRPTEGQKTVSARGHKIVERFTKGEDLRVIAVREGRSLQKTRKLVFEFLVDGGFPAKSAYHLRAALVPEVRETAGTAALHKVPERLRSGDLLLGELSEELEKIGAVPAGASAEWAAHIVSTYTTEVPFSTWSLWVTRRPEFDGVLAAVASGCSTIAEVASLLEHRLWPSVMIGELTTENGPLQRDGHWSIDPTTKHVHTDNRFGLHICPHCGAGITRYVLVPENERGLLCAQCRRAPSETSPVFPESYLCFDEIASNVVIPAAIRLKAGDKLSAGQVASILADYQSGVPTLEIVDTYGIGTQRMYKLLDSHGIARRSGTKRKRPNSSAASA